MTLTELRYIVAVARERHFGRAAESCFVSQPTLSVGIKKLEDELNVTIFERNTGITLTVIGEQIVQQAHKILDEAARLKQIAIQGQDPLYGPLRLSTIYTIGPYLFPDLIPIQLSLTPQMPLILTEDYTSNLLTSLRQGEIDCALLALPVPQTGLQVVPLYKEDFVIALPSHHPLAKKSSLSIAELQDETMLLLTSGHCFRDQVLEACPEQEHFYVAGLDGVNQVLEGSSLETIRHMVAAGLGFAVMPVTATYKDKHNKLVKYIPLKNARHTPHRTIALVYRKSFVRIKAIEALMQAIRATTLEGVHFL